MNYESIKKEGRHLIIDYFSCTFPLLCYQDDYESIIVNQVREMISFFFNYEPVDGDKEEAYNRFKYIYTIGEYITLKLGGPLLKSGHKSCMIEMKGEGCREFERLCPKKTWIDLLEFFILKLGGRCSRIDVTIDDYEGTIIDFNWVKNKLDSKFFTTTFRNKDYTIHGNTSGGYSLQFGSRVTQMLVIYEKLKEQLNKKKECIQDYWVRYEMRYFHDKANDVCLDLIDEGLNGFRKYCFGIFYKMLDIKEDNNYGLESQNKVITDPLWLKFLEDVEKVEIRSSTKRKSTYDSYYNYAFPVISYFYLVNLIINNGDFYATDTEILKIAVDGLDSFDAKKLKRLNYYLEERNLKSIDMNVIKEYESIMNDELDDRRLPF